MNLLDYAIAGWNAEQTDSLWSSDCWLSEQAGRICRLHNLYPQEIKKSRGYSIIVNRQYIINFNSNTLEFESIKSK